MGGGRGGGGGGRVGLLMLSFFLSETSTRQKLNLCGLYSSRRFHGIYILFYFIFYFFFGGGGGVGGGGGGGGGGQGKCEWGSGWGGVRIDG